MSKAISTNTTPALLPPSPCRLLAEFSLATIAAASVPPAVTPTALASLPDASLLATVAAFHEVDAEQNSMAADVDGLRDIVMDKWDALVDQVHDTTPTTVEGAKAKASVVAAVIRYSFTMDRGGSVDTDADYYEKIAYRFVRDLALVGGPA